MLDGSISGIFWGEFAKDLYRGLSDWVSYEDRRPNFFILGSLELLKEQVQIIPFPEN
jgi:hypothetical protein